MAKTRLGLYGGPRMPYGSFAGKTEAEVSVGASRNIVIYVFEWIWDKYR